MNVGFCKSAGSRKGVIFSLLASLATIASSAGANITMVTQQSGAQDWDTASSWTGGLGATAAVAANPAAVFELLPGARMQTPASDTAAFPGSLLIVDGSGSFVNGLAPGDVTAEIRFAGTSNAVVTFPHLVMNGGQLNVGSDGVTQVSGQIDISKNTAIYNESPNDRGFLIDAYLTGTGTIEYHGYNKTGFEGGYTNNLNIAGATNTFSGRWDVVVGTLLGTGANSLGTNDILVRSQGALETTYDVTNNTGTLTLDGAMYLHQTNTFRRLTVGGAPVARGTYSFTQLNEMFPTHFPLVWTPQTGAESFGEGSGSITVLEDNTIPVTLTVSPIDARVAVGQSAVFSAQASGPISSVQWYTNDVAIDGATSLTYVTPPATAEDNNTVYKVVIANNVNQVQGTAKLTIGQLVETKGFLKDEIWFGEQYDKDSIQTTTDTPAVTKYLSSLEAASNQGDFYAEKISGWITPSVSGDYIFFLSADADANLYLSPDADPAHKMLIAMEDQGNPPRTWTGGTGRVDANRSDVFTGSTITLEAGQKYYIEVDHHETTGADNVAVTAILDGQADPANGTASTLTGSMLSSEAVDGVVLSIVTQPQAQTVNAGSTATFTVAVNSSTTNLVYQWQKNGVDIAGATSASYMTPVLSAGDSADYRVLVSAPGAQLQTSDVARLTVGGSSGTPDATRIKNLTVSGGAIHFVFATQAGFSYTVEYKSLLSDASWTTLKTVTGTGTDATVDDPIVGTTRFYRVTAR